MNAPNSTPFGPTSLDAPSTPVDKLKKQILAIQMRLQFYLDMSMPYRTARWGFCLALFLVYALRVLNLHGWYIVSYALGIYLLNLLLLFLSPKLDPALELDDDDDDIPLASPMNQGRGSLLPTRSDDEFKPFIRRLPEFKCWWSAVRAIALGFFCTFFSVFDVPVFWPILVIYFIILFMVTMRRQIKHMIKYRYLPFTVGKKRWTQPAPAK